MEDAKWERGSALGGILFVILVLASAFLPGSPPKPSDSALKIARFVRDNDDALRWAAYLGALAGGPRRPGPPAAPVGDGRDRAQDAARGGRAPPPRRGRARRHHFLRC